MGAIDGSGGTWAGRERRLRRYYLTKFTDIFLSQDASNMALLHFTRLTLALSIAGQNTYFHLNHPIKWIRLVGVIVAFDEFPTRWILLLDDSSGALIEVTCGRPQPPNTTTSLNDHNIPSAGMAKPTMALEGVTSTGRPIDLSGIDIGTVVKVKGKIGTFRGEKQMHLERICMLRQPRP